jgi:hypothetical protein
MLMPALLVFPANNWVRFTQYGFLAQLSYNAQQNRDDRDDQQNVNKSTQSEGCDHPQQPQNNQNNGDGVQHVNTSLVLFNDGALLIFHS